MLFLFVLWKVLVLCMLWLRVCMVCLLSELKDIVEMLMIDVGW